MRRLSGPLLMVTGVLDIAYVLVSHHGQLAAIAGDGFLGAVEPDAVLPALDRQVAFWHLAFGLLVLVSGALIHWTQARTETLPIFLGWSLLAIGAAGVILMPVSGFWLVLPQAVGMIVASRREGSGAVKADRGGRVA